MLMLKLRWCLTSLRSHQKFLSQQVQNFTIPVEHKSNKKSRWGIEHLYMQSHNNGKTTDFHTGFLDTHLKSSVAERRHARNILLLMNEADLDNADAILEVQESFVASLYGHNCRVIIPFLPGSKTTEKLTDRGGFERQMLGERTGFLLDFITALNIRRLDMVVGHSFACLPAFTLTATTPSILNLTLINPPPLHTSPCFIIPRRKSFLMVELYERMYGRWLGRRMLQRVKVMIEACHRGGLDDDQAIHFIRTLHGVPYSMVENLVTSFNISSCNLLTISNNILSSLSSSSSSSPCGGDTERLLESLEMLEIAADDIVNLNEDLKEVTKISQNPDLKSASPSSSSRRESLKRRCIFLASKESFIFKDKDSSTFISQQIIHLLNKTTKT